MPLTKKKRFKKGAKMRSDGDALGSYTGVVPNESHELPVQDADDL